MKAVIGSGCIGYGFKEKPADIKEFIYKFLEGRDLDSFLYDLVEQYGECTYEDEESCECCGDYYTEYTLEVE